MAQSTTLGRLLVELALQDEQFRAGVDAASQKLKGLGDEATAAGRRGRGGASALNDAFGRLGTTLLGVFSARAIARFAYDAVQAAGQVQSALLGLGTVAKAFGASQDQARAAAEDLAGTGFISVTEAAQGFKNLLASGLSLEQATKLMHGLTEQAVFNRQAHYDLGAAVVATTEGIKNEQSILADATGTTTNLSQMYKAYAASVGKTTDELTSAEKAQAAYNGFLQETVRSAGDMERSLNTVQGQQAQLTAEWQRARVEIGEFLVPAFLGLVSAVKPVVVGLRDMIETMPRLTEAVVTASGPLGNLIARLRQIGMDRQADAGLKAQADAYKDLVVSLNQTADAAEDTSAAVTTSQDDATGEAAKAAQRIADAWRAAMEAVNRVVKESETAHSEAVGDEIAVREAAADREIAEAIRVFSAAIDIARQRGEDTAALEQKMQDTIDRIRATAIAEYQRDWEEAERERLEEEAEAAKERQEKEIEAREAVNAVILDLALESMSDVERLEYEKAQTLADLTAASAEERARIEAAYDQKIRDATIERWRETFTEAAGIASSVLSSAAGAFSSLTGGALPTSLADLIALAGSEEPEDVAAFAEEFALRVGENIGPILDGIAAGLPAILDAVVAAIPAIAAALAENIGPIVAALTDAVPDILLALADAVGVVAPAIVDAFVTELIPRMPEIAVALVKAIVQALTSGVVKSFSSAAEGVFGESAAGFGKILPFLSPVGGMSSLAALAGLKGLFGGGEAQAGVPYVPRTVRMTVHEGEAVVPRERNPAAPGASSRATSPAAGGLPSSPDGWAPIALTVAAEGRVLDGALVTAARRGRAPGITRMVRRAAGVTVGFDRGRFQNQAR